MSEGQNDSKSIELSENPEFIKDESPLERKDLIFASNFLRGAFSLDVFKGNLAKMNDRPLISRKDSEEPTIYPEVNLMEENPPNSENYKYI